MRKQAKEPTHKTRYYIEFNFRYKTGHTFWNHKLNSKGYDSMAWPVLFDSADEAWACWRAWTDRKRFPFPAHANSMTVVSIRIPIKEPSE